MKHWIRLIGVVLIVLPAVVTAEGTWLPVKDVSLVIEPGSVLDFSSLNPLTEPVKNRLVVNRDGHFASQDAPGKALHFLMGSLGFGVSTGSFPSHTMADLYARQFRMHGYNMARLDFIDETLMTDRMADFDFNPEQLDRLNYLLFALKREGIYYILNGLSSGNGAYGNIKERWVDQRHVELGVYYDANQKQHWKRLMEKLFVPVNPYTGLSILNDPALAGLIMVNEGGLAFTNRIKASDQLRPQFADWLRKKYGSTSGLAQAWSGELKSGETLEANSIEFPLPTAWTSQRMADTQQFFFDLEKSTAYWMIQYMRQLGYKGMLTAYNNWKSPAAHASRSQFDWVDLHNYFSDPSNGLEPGSVMKQDSMLYGGATYIRELAAGRHVGKAFTVSEFGQVFWNKYRRESGLAVPAYAALQGWDVICQHAHAIQLSYASGSPRKDTIGPFNVSLDPVARAGETLAALLFERGDVAPAKHMVGIKLTPKFAFNENAHLGNIPEDLSRISLVTGTALDWQGRMENRYDAQAEPGIRGLTISGKAVENISAAPSLATRVDTLVSTYAEKLASKIGKVGFVVDDRWVGRVDALRMGGLIDKDNQTDAATGIYQSDTGQVVMNTQKNRLTVVTPNTEAVVFDEVEPITLNHLRVVQADGPALVSVSSMDGQSLNSSKRMLVILATDARNSGMRFSDNAETTLQDLGRTPVLMRTVSITLKLRNRNATQLKVYSNNLRGQRGDLIHVKQEADGISFVLDTARLSHGPTTYFEITSQD